MLSWLRDKWWARQRAVDLQILWPICKRHATSLDEAKFAFMVHAAKAPCWRDHYGENGLVRFIEAMR